MSEKRPDRILGGLHTEFWEHCNRGEMMLQRCDECASWMWPPTPVCDRCLSEDLTWCAVSGRGIIHSYCVFERSYFADIPTPHPVIMVALEEGPWFVSNPTGIALEDISVGLPVQVQFLRCADAHGEYALPVFGTADGVAQSSAPGPP